MSAFKQKVPMSLAAVACAAHLGCAQPRGAAHASPRETHSFVNRNGLIALSVRIGESEPLGFLLDTGASPCVVDSAVASSLDLSTVASSKEREGGAGTFRSRVTAQPVNLRIGDAVLPCHETIVLDLSGMTAVVGQPVAGIVGGDFFRNRVVRIDFDNSVITVFDRGDYTPDTSTRIPIRIDANRAYLSALLSVPGGPQRARRGLLIDTGSRDYVDDWMVTQSAQGVREVDPTGLGSGGRAALGSFSEVRIGNQVLHDVPGVAGNVSIVGMGVLGRFNLVFDYDGGWLALEKRER